MSDPIGLVVELVAAVEPTLAGGQVRAVTTGVAGGRAKARRLAAALASRPGVLVDGRSPAPRVVGELLLALHRAGATAICPPCCAECGKQLGSLQRRGQHWYCTVLRSAHRRLRRLRGHQTRLLPRPGGATSLRQVPGPRRPGPDHSAPAGDR